MLRLLSVKSRLLTTVRASTPSYNLDFLPLVGSMSVPTHTGVSYSMARLYVRFSRMVKLSSKAYTDKELQ